jgi:peptidoglycan-associated lipoprotein
MQTRIIATLAASLLLGVGCSHAKPKSEPGPRTAGATAKGELPQHAETAHAQDDQPSSAGSRSIYFAFDSALIAYGARPVLQEVRSEEKTSGRALRVEGNCDERGTTEYNLALGDQRARVAAKYLQAMGVPEENLEIVSYGSERPKNPGHDEEAWANNRRADFVWR